MSYRLPSCVTLALFAAGCSSPEPEQMQYSYTLPPPSFDPQQPRSFEEGATELRGSRFPVRKPIRTPAGKIALSPPNQAQPFGALIPVPQDGYALQVAQAVPTQSPYRSVPSAPFAKRPIQTVPEILQPLLETTAATSVVVAEPIAYPKYVSVGPEYFGSDSDIAPYVISHAGEPSTTAFHYAEAVPTGAVTSNVAVQIAQQGVQETPVPTPAPETPYRQQIAILPQPSLPQTPPQRAPVEASPRIVHREPDSGVASTMHATVSEQADAVHERDNQIASIQADSASIEIQEVSAPAQMTAITSSFYVATPTVNARAIDPAKGTVLRAQPPEPIETRRMSQIDPVQTTSRLPAPTPQPIALSRNNDQILPTAHSSRAAMPSGCLVNRGLDDRMILVCEGANLTSREVLWAMIEGESALRNLRSFDLDQQVIDTYGFDPSRYTAITRGPKSRTDVEFLRRLKESARRTRFKGRSFEVYEMQGNSGLATVLVEDL